MAVLVLMLVVMIVVIVCWVLPRSTRSCYAARKTRSYEDVQYTICAARVRVRRMCFQPAMRFNRTMAVERRTSAFAVLPPAPDRSLALPAHNLSICPQVPPLSAQVPRDDVPLGSARGFKRRESQSQPLPALRTDHSAVQESFGPPRKSRSDKGMTGAYVSEQIPDLAKKIFKGNRRNDLHRALEVSPLQDWVATDPFVFVAGNWRSRLELQKQICE